MSNFSDITKNGYVTFRNEMSDIIEDGSWIAGALFNLRPFLSFEDLYTKLCDVLNQLPIIAQVGVIRCYPQLISAGNSALSKESHDEHEIRFKCISDSYTINMKELNERYVEKFEFPFICCVKEQSTENIPKLIHARIDNSNQEEVYNNIQQIQRIAWHRLLQKFKISYEKSHIYLEENVAM